MNRYIAFTIFTIGLVFSVLFYTIGEIDKPHQDEVGKISILSFKTGGQFGWIRYKGPMIRVSLYEDFLIISGREKIKIQYTNLSFKKNSFFLFSSSLQVLENSKEHPEDVYLLTPDNPEFFAILQRKGVKILD